VAGVAPAATRPESRGGADESTCTGMEKLMLVDGSGLGGWPGKTRLSQPAGVKPRQKQRRSKERRARGPKRQRGVGGDGYSDGSESFDDLQFASRVRTLSV
jgi:hypothetical protein